MKTNAFLPIVFLSLMGTNAMAAYPSDTDSTQTPDGSATIQTTPQTSTQTTPQMTTQPGMQTNQSNTQQNSMSAIDVILQDHAKIKQMIGDLDKQLNSDVAQSKSLFNDLKAFLVKHETMEQQVWYPELEKKSDLKNIVEKLKKQEKEAGDEINKIDSIQDDKKWVAEVKKFIKAVERHAKDEETELFPKVKKSFDKSSLDQIGDKMKNYQTQM